jgi:tetratricopeptide (TPR) repeat protein
MKDIPYLFPATMIAVIVSAGFLLAGPAVPFVEAEPAFTAEEIEAAKESIALSLMGQLQMSMEGLLFMKAMDYLHIGIEQRMLTQAERDAGVREWGSTTTAVGLDHPEGRNMMLDRHEDWRGILGELDRHIRPYAVDADGNPIHVHDDPVELIPWYQLAVRLNPRLERMYTLGAFYMADFAQEPDEAFELLMAGVQANPQSFEINFALGRLLFEYRHRLEELEHPHDHSHDHDHDDIPENAEVALDMAIGYLRTATEAGDRAHERHRERQQRGEQSVGFDEFAQQVYHESYLFLSRALVERGQLEEALEIAERGFQRTNHNLLHVQRRTVQRLIDGDAPGDEPFEDDSLDAST